MKELGPDRLTTNTRSASQTESSHSGLRKGRSGGRREWRFEEGRRKWHFAGTIIN
jgi:hypothetical protein